MVWAVTRSNESKPRIVPPGTPIATPTPTPNPPTKTPDPAPKDGQKTPPDQPKVTPNPPDPVKPPPPPPPPPPAPTVTADYFPYKPGLTLNYVEVRYMNEGMGVAVHQKNEFKEGGLIETNTTKGGMVQGGRYLAGKAVDWNVSQAFLKAATSVLARRRRTSISGSRQNAEMGRTSSGAKGGRWDPVSAGQGGRHLGIQDAQRWHQNTPSRIRKKDGKDAVLSKADAVPPGGHRVDHLLHLRQGCRQWNG